MKHIVGFSGGIDSQRAALWVRDRYEAKDIILTNSPAGNWEDPLTIEFIKWYSANIFPVEIIPAKIKDMWETGFERVGCAPCINSGKEDVLMWDIKRPEMIEKVRRMERPACESRYGLCE